MENYEIVKKIYHDPALFEIKINCKNKPKNIFASVRCTKCRGRFEIMYKSAISILNKVK